MWQTKNVKPGAPAMGNKSVRGGKWKTNRENKSRLMDYFNKRVEQKRGKKRSGRLSENWERGSSLPAHHSRETTQQLGVFRKKERRKSFSMRKKRWPCPRLPRNHEHADFQPGGALGRSEQKREPPYGIIWKEAKSKHTVWGETN